MTYEEQLKHIDEVLYMRRMSGSGSIGLRPNFREVDIRLIKLRETYWKQYEDDGGENPFKGRIISIESMFNKLNSNFKFNLFYHLAMHLSLFPTSDDVREHIRQKVEDNDMVSYIDSIEINRIGVPRWFALLTINEDARFKLNERGMIKMKNTNYFFDNTLEYPNDLSIGDIEDWCLYVLKKFIDKSLEMYRDYYDAV